MPVVAAQHHAAFVGQDFDGFVEGGLEVSRAEQPGPGEIDPDVPIDKGESQ